ncbi:hypothetical protein G5V57_24180 [Nordella sp. HKS 07]|uniref:hypothetical protein n=1 Tax=Nordella sp. HKS 07 TaxID=2712222 RepID=UPI0013E1B9A1|nr:hypothetical protein [Nordella sp. HKS 07]QIG50553.1 hypothetical protein G5V57_24180 [Nordella sp. HKS 07]
MADDPVSPEYLERLNELARFLDKSLNGEVPGKQRQIGFALLIFEFDKPARVNYISNADRATMLEALAEFLARQPRPDPE